MGGQTGTRTKRGRPRGARTILKGFRLPIPVVEAIERERRRRVRAGQTVSAAALIAEAVEQASWLTDTQRRERARVAQQLELISELLDAVRSTRNSKGGRRSDTEGEVIA